MRALSVLQKVLARQSVAIHKRRLAALLAGVDSLLRGASLTVTALGRRLDSPARTKHNIKRMDRLLSNKKLHDERLVICGAIAHHLCHAQSRPIILVDWSDIVERERLMVLRAALAVQGRAIPLYEATYPLTGYNSPRTHLDFLQTLKTLLPGHCRPIIVTDAGFRGPWFDAVGKLGWHWVGRVRNAIKYRLHSRQQWRDSQDLYYRATSTPRYLGSADLSHKRPYACHLYLYKKTSQGRKGNRSVAHSKRHSSTACFKKQQKDPWLIATNLDPADFSPKHMMALYGKRMQIEEGFRDLKSHQYGFGLSSSRSKQIERLDILLLIAALATLCLWWIGLAARNRGWHRHFQANTANEHHTLSVPFLALEVLKRPTYALFVADLVVGHQLLLSQIAAAQTQGLEIA